MYFLWVNVTFFDPVNMIHEVITTADPIPYIAEFMFVGDRNKTLKDEQNTYMVLPYIKNI